MGKVLTELMSSLFPIVSIFIVMYFFMIRPQNKKAKEHKDMVDSLKPGDKIYTYSGIIGTIVKVISDSELDLQISNNVNMRILKSSVGGLFRDETLNNRMNRG